MPRIRSALLLAFALNLPLVALIDPDGTTGAAVAQEDEDDDDAEDDDDTDDTDDADDDRPAERTPVADDDDEDDRPAPPPSVDDDDEDRPAPTPDTDDDDDRATPRAGPAPAQAPAPATAPRAAPAAPRAAPPPPPPLRRNAEIVTLGLPEATLAALIAQGFTVIEERPLDRFQTVVQRLRVPDGLTDEAARDLVRGLPGGEEADFNHYYRTEQADFLPAAAPGPAPLPCNGPHCAGFAQIGWPLAPTRTPSCGVAVTIGMVDTGLNPDHATFAGAALEVARMTEDARDPSGAMHGTAVASILIGAPDSRSPGLMPWARLVAADVFHRESGDERADVFTLIAGIDHVVDQGARVVNLSLAGPPNTALEQAVADLVAGGVVIVAAAGNGGPRAEPAYPAAYPGVIAVAAVDGRGQVYRRSQQGDHIDIAAPGVDVWAAASISGARPKTGTSFAAPFVAAAAALILQERPELTPAEVEATLTGAAADLGDPGPDPVFGHGLLQAGALCPRG